MLNEAVSHWNVIDEDDDDNDEDDDDDTDSDNGDDDAAVHEDAHADDDDGDDMADEAMGRASLVTGTTGTKSTRQTTAQTARIMFSIAMEPEPSVRRWLARPAWTMRLLGRASLEEVAAPGLIQPLRCGYSEEPPSRK